MRGVLNLLHSVHFKILWLDPNWHIDNTILRGAIEASVYARTRGDRILGLRRVVITYVLLSGLHRPATNDYIGQHFTVAETLG